MCGRRSCNDVHVATDMQVGMIRRLSLTVTGMMEGKRWKVTTQHAVRSRKKTLMSGIEYEAHSEVSGTHRNEGLGTVADSGTILTHTLWGIAMLLNNSDISSSLLLSRAIITFRVVVSSTLRVPLLFTPFTLSKSSLNSSNADS